MCVLVQTLKKLEKYSKFLHISSDKCVGIIIIFMMT